MAEKKNKKLPAADMLEHLKQTARHLGMDDDETSQFAHRGMKRAGYKITPAYSDPDDDDDDDDDEDDLMPRRRNKGSGDTGTRRKASGDGIWD
jgi:hypothetical protein